MIITTKTQKVGLLGWPLSHSLSPAMHNAAFAASGLDYVYLPLPTPPALLPQAVTGLAALGFSGVNVTIPHKVAIIDCLDDLDDSARLAGAVNTVVISAGRLIGYNTDAGGYIGSLLSAGVAVKAKHAVVLGAGGAARAVVAGLVEGGIAAVGIGARDTARAAAVAGLFAGTGTPVNSSGWDSAAFAETVAKADIIVNTTPLGMYPDSASQPPLAWAHIKPTAVISDLVYNPLQTGFLAEASRRGHTVVTGEGMLLEQGALAFQLWTGVPAPLPVMRQALLAGLSGNPS
ncbi:shikimate dehydrogenase [Sporomusa termitida]|uniref:Shikimate dehydrogenase (NADP(+)) n=1 Tax=Sporomusa termitida TaxID=2377 RepID=A0A517DSM4_9FIRM|nr:shikimate dehydrogenase [Sporomusa termitida]QDR80318.1 Shikimate dehydrogenase (NADP(+)) [Sporomusa termitida]